MCTVGVLIHSVIEVVSEEMVSWDNARPVTDDGKGEEAL